MVTIRPCTTHEEFRQVAALEITIWSVSDEDTITPHIMHVIDHIGGLVLGAFTADDAMIGMAVATPTQTSGMLWSHMAGVSPEYQGQGIGYEIKQHQRQWALEHGYDEIHWSFDPAMRRNAHFNFHHLGVITNIYHHNFYGMMTDGINAGVPSDRFEAIWRLNQLAEKPSPPADIPFVLSGTGQQLGMTTDFSTEFVAVACPYDFPALKAEKLSLGIIWRQQMRTVLQAAFSKGYYVVDFITDHDTQHCHYVLQRQD